MVKGLVAAEVMGRFRDDKKPKKKKKKKKKRGARTGTAALVATELCRDFNNKAWCPRGAGCRWKCECLYCGSGNHGGQACPEGG